MQIISRKPITWKFSPPPYFPCTICGNDRATVQLVIKEVALKVYPVVCLKCADLTELDFKTWFYGTGKDGE